ncbi:hypothetical protein DPEC_G00279060 [Dallia pectoralis]|uniref:Uncharacterized protein n=1 Tax=Dallia pectoralis TaxID=75939 RepID=A0ACC2FM82_DALPE|nr:hypothetical protein DPEC_G00279060 [Dallia pectoralis]
MIRASSVCSGETNAPKGTRMMRRAGVVLGYFMVRVLLCNAEGEPGQKSDGFILVPIGANDSKGNGESVISERPHANDNCWGYYDVMGQWDPPFVCQTGSYLYCCGTCGFRFCCEFTSSRLDQTTCKNYDTSRWVMTRKPPSKANDPSHDPTKDKTNLIVYIICGVVAIMALVGIFTKLGLEKAHRPHRENMSRALAQVMRQPGPGEPSEDVGDHGPHYENMQANRLPANSLQANQMNSGVPGSSLMQGMGSPTQPYPSLGQIPSPYEQQQPGMELNKYTSLKAVADKDNDNFYANRRHMVEMATKGGLPMHPIHRAEQEPSNPYSPPLQPCLKQNGQKSKSTKGHGGHSSSSHNLSYGSNTIANPGVQKNWDGTETMGRRQKKQCTIEQVNEMHGGARAQHYQPTQPYFVTNSKTEVTV